MATRLYINVSQAYMPLYIQHSLQLPAVSIAVIPLIMFISGFVVSIVNKPISKFLGRKWSMIGGCLVGVAGAVWVQFGSLTDESFTKYEIYAISVLIGAAGSQMLITSLCIVADLISNNLDSSAFVYGCMSLVDKFSNGITIMAIQKMTPNPCGCPKEINFYSNALVWTCCAAALLGMVAVGSLLPATIGSRKRDQRSVNVNEVIQRDLDPELVQQEHVET